AHRVNGLLGTLEYAYHLTAKNSKITSELIERVEQQNEVKKDVKTSSPSEEVRLAFEKVTRLSNAIETGSFELMYQPQYESSSREITGAEALVRWRDENREWVMPQEFLPLVEKSGMMNTLGKWVLLKACYAAKNWQKRGFKAIPVAVNLNPAQFYDPQLVIHLTEALSAAKLEPKYLELEIQEATIAEHFDWALEICTNLSMMGVRFTIDDFGAGMLSLRQVTRLPVSKLKLDPGFLIQTAASRNVYEVIDGLVGLGEAFAMEVVVKGIETAEQAAELSGRKKHDLQGFFLGKPMEVVELEAALPREDNIRHIGLRRG
ncbi:MAG TPA: EAL domain-containing protein, partial [Pseudomonadales bacterium]|nr:EAL domain-containing protein [Pseudomonadales bacterium]